MQIDWLTFSAQIVNFVVLAWLLQRFLYRPVAAAMRARARLMTERTDAVAAREREVAAGAARIESLRAELARVGDAALAEAHAAARTEQAKLEAAARADVARRRQEWEAQLNSEQARFLDELKRVVSRSFFMLAGRALGDLGGADLQYQMTRRFVRRLEDLPPDQWAEIGRAGEGAGRLRIRTGAPLANGARELVTEALDRRIGAAVPLEFTVDGGVTGIEMQAGEREYSWTLESYLDRLEEAVAAEIARVSLSRDHKTEATAI